MYLPGCVQDVVFQHSRCWHLWSCWRHEDIYLFVFSPEEAWTVSALTVEVSESCQYLVPIFASSATNPVTQKRHPELRVIKYWHNGPERLWKNSKLNWTRPKQPAFIGSSLSKGLDQRPPETTSNLYYAQILGRLWTQESSLCCHFCKCWRINSITNHPYPTLNNPRQVNKQPVRYSSWHMLSPGRKCSNLLQILKNRF